MEKNLALEDEVYINIFRLQKNFQLLLLTQEAELRSKNHSWTVFPRLNRAKLCADGVSMWHREMLSEDRLLLWGRR